MGSRHLRTEHGHYILRHLWDQGERYRHHHHIGEHVINGDIFQEGRVH